MTNDKFAQQAVKLAQKVLLLYFVEHDNERLMQLFSKKCSSWIGWAENEYYMDYTALFDTFAARSGEIPDVDITNMHSELIFHQGTLYIVFLHCRLSTAPETGLDVSVPARYTFIFSVEGDELKINHIHSSASWEHLEKNKVAPRKYGKENFDRYIKELEKSSLAASLSINAPAGIKCCKLNADYSAIFINRELWSMAGYDSMTGMLNETNGSIKKMIYAPDLPKVQRLMAAHCDGRPYTVNYRLLRQGGKPPVWVLERGICRTLTDERNGENDYFICTVLPLMIDNDEISYGMMLDSTDTDNPELPVEIFLRTALDIAANEPDKYRAVNKLLSLCCDICQTDGALIGELSRTDGYLGVFSQYNENGADLPITMPYASAAILSRYNTSDISQCSDTELLPEAEHNYIKSIDVAAYLSIKLPIDGKTDHILIFYMRGSKARFWTENERDVLKQAANVFKLVLQRGK